MNDEASFPWKYDERSSKIYTKDGDVIAELFGSDYGSGQDRKHGEFIVRACNAHEDLVYALKAFVDYYAQAGIGDCTEADEEAADNGDRDDEFDGDEIFNVRLGRAVLKLAKGEESWENT